MRSGLLNQYEMYESTLLERIPSISQIQSAVARFRERTGSLMQRKACAGCGLVFVHSKLRKVDLGAPQIQHLRHGVSFSVKFRQLSAPGRSAHNCIEHAGDVYTLAPALVFDEDGIRRAHFCMLCLKVAPSQTFPSFVILTLECLGRD